MTISPTLQSYLKTQDATYELVAYKHTSSSMETVQAAHVAADSVAKVVVVKVDDHYVMMVIPSSEHVDFAELKRHFEAPVEMASEEELGRLFPDCALGAVPPAAANGNRLPAVPVRPRGHRRS